MPPSVTILFGAALTAATALALGLLLFSRVRVQLSRLEHYLFSYVTGSAILSFVLFFVCAAHLVRAGVFVAISVLAVGACLWSKAYRRDWISFGRLPVVERILLAAVMIAFGYVSLLHAMAPEHSPDGSTYHLGLVGRYFREQGFIPMPANMYAHLTQAMDLLFLFAYAFGRHSAAAMVHWTFLLALPLAMVAYARRFGFPTAGVVAAILVFASPVVLIDGSSAYNDVALACVLFVLFYLLRMEIWIPAGILTGFAFAIKYTGFIAAPYALIAARRLQRVAVVAACLLLVTVPWAVKNYAYTGNPVAPFFNSVFPNPNFYPDFERNYGERMRHYGDVRWPEIPLQATVHGVRLAGFVGPIFLLLPVALLALRQAEGRRLLLAAVVFTATYPLNIGTRFLIPALPFWALAFAMAVANVRGLALMLALAHAMLSWPPVTGRYTERGAWALDPKPPLKAALRITPEDKYLREKTRGYDMARMAEERVPAGKRIFAIGAMIAEGYTTRDVVVGFQSSFGRRTIDLLWTPLIDDYKVLRWQELRWPPRSVRRIRLLQTAAHEADVWSISELRFFDNGRELPRSPAWRVRASPNPWEAWLAFDDIQITRWSAHDVLRPGQFLEVEFPRPEAFDRMRLESTRDQYQVRLTVELDGERVNPTNTEQLGPEPLELRRAISSQLKREGIDYIMLDNGDYGATDVRDHLSDWGVTLIDERAGARLYRIE